MNGTDTGSEIVHTGWRNSSVNKGRNERDAKGTHISNEGGFCLVFVFGFFLLKQETWCLFMLHSSLSWGRWEGLRKGVVLQQEGKSQMFTPKSSISLVRKDVKAVTQIYYH